MKPIKIWDKIKESIFGFIPRHIKSDQVIAFFEWLRKRQRRRNISYQEHYEQNVKNWKNHKNALKRNHGFIEDQQAWEDLSYGSCKLSYNGCEVLAVYNACHALGMEAINLCDLIAAFEADGMVYSGKFGTSPVALADYFEKNGYSVCFSVEEGNFENLAIDAKCVILTFYNDRRDIKRQVHTVALTEEHGCFLAHNVYGNGLVLGPFSCIEDFMRQANQGFGKTIALIGIY